MLNAGAIEAEDMLPEVALVKLMWSLGQGWEYDEVCANMTENIAGEISGSSGYDYGSGAADMGSKPSTDV
jgi:glutamyl-tRNA(Gln) amidotransferase subunit D